MRSGMGSSIMVNMDWWLNVWSCSCITGSHWSQVTKVWLCWLVGTQMIRIWGCHLEIDWTLLWNLAGWLNGFWISTHMEFAKLVRHRAGTNGIVWIMELLWLNHVKCFPPLNFFVVVMPWLDAYVGCLLHVVLAWLLQHCIHILMFA